MVILKQYANCLVENHRHHWPLDPTCDSRNGLDWAMINQSVKLLPEHGELAVD